MLRNIAEPGDAGGFHRVKGRGVKCEISWPSSPFTLLTSHFPVTRLEMMACFCSLSSAITLCFARIARSSRPFAQSRNRTIAACSAGGGDEELG